MWFHQAWALFQSSWWGLLCPALCKCSTFTRSVVFSCAASSGLWASFVSSEPSSSCCVLVKTLVFAWEPLRPLSAHNHLKALTEPYQTCFAGCFHSTLQAPPTSFWTWGKPPHPRSEKFPRRFLQRRSRQSLVRRATPSQRSRRLLASWRHTLGCCKAQAFESGAYHNCSYQHRFGCLCWHVGWSERTNQASTRPKKSRNS